MNTQHRYVAALHDRSILQKLEDQLEIHKMATYTAWPDPGKISTPTDYEKIISRRKRLARRLTTT